MSVVVAEKLVGGPLRGVDLSLDTGRHALLASPLETAELVALLCGARRPRGGTVRVHAREPHRSPDVRSRIGCLFASEPPLAGRTVRTALTFALGSHRGVESALAALGLGAWIDRPTRGLSAAEHRSLALAIALAIPDTVLVVLWEPFADTCGIARGLLLDRLAKLSETSCLVCATSSVRDALALEGRVIVLSQGVVVRHSIALVSELAPGSIRDFVVRTERARDLAAALTRRAEVVGVDWDGRVAPRAVRVRGRDAETVARAIVETARTEQIPIESLVGDNPSLALAQSASQAAMRAAHDLARRVALPNPPANLASGSPTGLGVPPISNLPGVESSAATLGAVGGDAPATGNLPGVESSAVPLGGVMGASVERMGGTPAAPPPPAGAAGAVPDPDRDAAPAPIARQGWGPSGEEEDR